MRHGTKQYAIRQQDLNVKNAAVVWVQKETHGFVENVDTRSFFYDFLISQHIDSRVTHKVADAQAFIVCLVKQISFTCIRIN